jgi:hypothetical protein
MFSINRSNSEEQRWDFDDVYAMTEHLRRDAEVARQEERRAALVAREMLRRAEVTEEEWEDANLAAGLADDAHRRAEEALLRGEYMARKFLVERRASWRIADRDNAAYCMIGERPKTEVTA